MITEKQRKKFKEDTDYFIQRLRAFHLGRGIELKEITTTTMMTYDRESKTIMATFYTEVKEEK